jgi:transposase
VFTQVARCHGVSRGALWGWRKKVRCGELAAARPVPEFVQIRVMPVAAGSVRQVRAAGASMNAADPQTTRPPARRTDFGVSRIEIVLPDGTCVRVGDQVGAAALRRVIAVLRG